ncbi:MAG: hypothetical protein ACRCXY_03445 [Fusobacteriaceae bacterium]
MDSKIIEKLKKIKKLADDTGAAPGERESALQMYCELKEKYKIDDDHFLEDKFFIFKANNEYEKTLLTLIIVNAIGYRSFYRKPKMSKLKFIIKTDENTYIKIKNDFDFHKEILHKILDGAVTGYTCGNVDMPNLNDDDNEEIKDIKLDPITQETMKNTFMQTQNKFRNKIRIENEN